MVSEAVISGSESTSRLPFLKHLPEKRGTKQHTSPQTMYFTLTAALLLFLFLRLRPTVALGALLLNFLFLLLTKGPKVKAEMSVHLSVCRERPRVPRHPCSAHRSAFRGRYRKSPSSAPVSPTETSSFWKPVFKYIKVLVYVEG